MEIKPFKMRVTPKQAQVICDIIEEIIPKSILWADGKISTMKSKTQVITYGISRTQCMWRKSNRWFNQLDVPEITPDEFIKMYGGEEIWIG